MTKCSGLVLLSTIRLAHCGPFGNSTTQIGKPRMIYRRTSCNSEILTKDTGVIRGSPMDGVTNETRNDSVVLTKDTGVIRGLPTDGDVNN